MDRAVQSARTGSGIYTVPGIPLMNPKEPDLILRGQLVPSAKGKWQRRATSSPACALSGQRELSGVCGYLVGTVWAPKASAFKHCKVRTGFFPVCFCVVAWQKPSDMSHKAVALRSSLCLAEKITAFISFNKNKNGEAFWDTIL